MIRRLKNFRLIRLLYYLPMERMRNKDLENAWAVQWIRQEKCAKLEEENKKLNEEIQRFKDNAMQDMSEITELESQIKKLEEELKWWKDLVHKAKEFEYDEDGMDYIWQNTKI